MKALKLKSILFGLLIVSTFTSCEKFIFDTPNNTTDYKGNLDYIWDQCDQKYSYFELKDVNWDLVYHKYSDSLKWINSDEEFFDLIGGMLSELRDDHVNLISDFNVSRFGVKYSAQDNFDWRIIEDNYIGYDYLTTGPFRHDFLPGDSIGYVRLSSFPGTITDANLDFIIKRYRNTQGLILDLRENGGGSVNEVFQILSRFTDVSTLIYHSRLRNGPNHDDFGEAEACYISPADGKRYTHHKVAFLVDRGTYSAGSFTSLGTKAIPNVVLVGDTTGGGLGVPNGGQLPNGWFYRFSISQTLDTQFDEQFELGVPPDVISYFDWNDLTKDEVIERAIIEITSKK
jgi:C-terminal processing protease CtpA/Prc